MNIDSSSTKVCWCGNDHLLPFSPAYSTCNVCGTLVSLDAPPAEKLLVKDDEADFYGKQYWLQHQTDALGFVDIQSRARRDLAERNLYWLEALLKYLPPPAKTLELGCAHGSFVALMQQAGYSATGVEMSPWVVDFGKQAFGIEVLLGPIEELDMPDGRLDAIVLMDVLEHLPDPLKTMARCLQLLKPDGLLLVQTPQFREDRSYEDLVRSNDRFLEMLIPDEHIYLFSTRSAEDLFKRLGAPYIYFEPAIFAHYDMFFAVSRAPLHPVETAVAENALLGSHGGRMALAMLDLRALQCDLAVKLDASEQNRHALGGQVQTLDKLVHDLEADRAARGEQIKSLTSLVLETEQDRSARGEQIKQLTALLLEAEQDRGARGEQIKTLTALLTESEQDRGARGEQIETLTALIHAAEQARQKEGQ